jgi:hypothetical protein
MEISPQDQSLGPVDEEQCSGSPRQCREYDQEDLDSRDSVWRFLTFERYKEKDPKKCCFPFRV